MYPHGIICARGRKRLVIDVAEQPNTARCHRSEARTDAAYKEDEKGKLYVDRNFRLYIKCSGNSRKQQNRCFNVAINISSTADHGVETEKAFSIFKARDQRRETGAVPKKHAKAGVDVCWKRPKLERVRACQCTYCIFFEHERSAHPLVHAPYPDPLRVDGRRGAAQSLWLQKQRQWRSFYHHSENLR